MNNRRIFLGALVLLLIIAAIFIFYRMTYKCKIAMVFGTGSVFKNKSYLYQVYYHNYGQKIIKKNDIVSFLVIICPQDKKNLFCINRHHWSTNSFFSGYFSVSEKQNKNNTIFVHDQFSCIKIDHNNNIMKTDIDIEFLKSFLINNMNGIDSFPFFLHESDSSNDLK
jgi:hypothetical protein